MVLYVKNAITCNTNLCVVFSTSSNKKKKKSIAYKKCVQHNFKPNRKTSTINYEK